MAGADDVVKAALKLIFSGSKAVDEAGVPVRYYHGTTKDLPVIKPGTYFTEDPGEGSAYTFWTDLKNAEKHKGKYSVISAPELAGKRLEYFGTISDIDDPKVGEFYATDNGIMRYKGNGTWDVASDLGIDSGSLDMSDYTIGIKPYDNSEVAKQMVDEYEEAVKRVYPGGVGGNVIPAYLNVKNPKEMPPLEGNRFGERLGADPKWVADEIERLKAQGYDSIVTTSDDPFYAMEGRKPPKQYMIFEPTQAKSAIGNTGEYDFTNPDITKSSGGSIREGYGPGGWVDDVVKMAGKVISGEGEDAAKAGIRAYQGSPDDFNGFVVREAGQDIGAENLSSISRGGHFYRGMTGDEYEATLGKGSGVKSTNPYSLPGEGTSFAEDAPTAESYVNFGRDDPRKTGKPTYLVEVAGSSAITKKPDGYFHAQDEIMPTRVWKMSPDNGRITAKQLTDLIRQYGIAGASAMLGYNLMEQLDPKQALAASMADQDYKSSRPQRSMGGNNSISGALNVARGMNGGK